TGIELPDNKPETGDEGERDTDGNGRSVAVCKGRPVLYDHGGKKEHTAGDREYSRGPYQAGCAPYGGNAKSDDCGDEKNAPVIQRMVEYALEPRRIPSATYRRSLWMRIRLF